MTKIFFEKNKETELHFDLLWLSFEYETIHLERSHGSGVEWS